jgi:hypothetical protein
MCKVRGIRIMPRARRLLISDRTLTATFTLAKLVTPIMKQLESTVSTISREMYLVPSVLGYQIRGQGKSNIESMTRSRPNVCHGSSRFKFGFLLLATSHNHGITSKKASATPSIVSRASTVFDSIVSEAEHLFSTGPMLIPPRPGAMIGKVKTRVQARTLNSREGKKKRIDRDQKGLLPLNGALMHSRLQGAKEGKALRQFPHLQPSG